MNNIKIVYNKLLRGWYVVRGPHQAPLNGRFETKEQAQAWLNRKAGQMKPYQVWVRQCNEWNCLFDTHNPTDAKNYAMNRIVHGNSVQRIEIRDFSGPLETVFDSAWEASK